MCIFSTPKGVAVVLLYAKTMPKRKISKKYLFVSFLMSQFFSLVSKHRKNRWMCSENYLRDNLNYLGDSLNYLGDNFYEVRT